MFVQLAHTAGFSIHRCYIPAIYTWCMYSISYIPQKIYNICVNNVNADFHAITYRTILSYMYRYLSSLIHLLFVVDLTPKERCNVCTINEE